MRDGYAIPIRCVAACVGLVALAGSAWADFLTGKAAFEARNYADAYLQLLPAGQAGDPRAQFLLGQLSDNGLGPVALDPVEAARWYRKAADAGHAEAQFALARAYALGRGVPQDKNQALLWLTRAAENGFDQAILDLARLYEEGRGVEKDQVRATGLIERAARAGSAEAQYLYAERLAAGIGIERNEQAAWEWFRRAAANGHPAALYRLRRGRVDAGARIGDTIDAYVWLTLAEQRGSGDVKRNAARDRAELAKSMTPDDIATAMARVKEWRPAATKTAEKRG